RTGAAAQRGQGGGGAPRHPGGSGGGRPVRGLLGRGPLDAAGSDRRPARNHGGEARNRGGVRLAGAAPRPRDRAARVAPLPGPRVRDRGIARAAAPGLRHAVRGQAVPRIGPAGGAVPGPVPRALDLRRRADRPPDPATAGHGAPRCRERDLRVPAARVARRPGLQAESPGLCARGGRPGTDLPRVPAPRRAAAVHHPAGAAAVGSARRRPGQGGFHLSDRSLKEERPATSAGTSPATAAARMAGGTAAPRGRAALPSPADALFLMLAFLVPALAGGRLVGSDGDAAAHVRLGQWMLEARGLVRTSLFAFTNEGEPFLAFAWGAEIVYAAAHRAGGFAAVALLAGCLIGATYALLYRFLRRQGVEPLLALAAVLLGAFCGSPHWLARPHLFTLLGVVVLLGLLERPGRRGLVLIALLFAVWANLHGGFLYGLILVGVYAAGDAGELWLGRRGAGAAAWRARLAYHGGALGVAALATLLNPHGPALLAHVAGFLGDGFILGAIDEYRSPDFHERYALPFLAALLLGTAGLALRRGRPRLPWLAVILTTTAFALYAARNIALFGVAAVPAAALALDADWRRTGWLARARRALAYGDAGGRLGPWSAAGLLLLLLLDRKSTRLNSSHVKNSYAVFRLQ